MNQRKGPSENDKRKSDGGSRGSGTKPRSAPERLTFKEQRKRLPGIERQQMEIHQSRNISTSGTDQFLWRMLGLILTLTFVSLYFTGNL